jgi:hypothetical protein
MSLPIGIVQGADSGPLLIWLRAFMRPTTSRRGKVLGRLVGEIVDVRLRMMGADCAMLATIKRPLVDACDSSAILPGWRELLCAAGDGRG